MFVCIAGKNDIAIEVTEYLLSKGMNFDFGVIYNRTETGINGFQRSFKAYAEKRNLKEYTLDEIYDIPNTVLISLEFDKIIHPEKFKDARLYNIHFSLLPAYKGMYTSALPILNNEKKSGVTFHRIDAGIDTGDIIAQQSFDLKDMTCKELYLNYIKFGTELVIKHIDSVIAGVEKAVPQEIFGSTYYSKKSIDYKNINIDLNQTAQGIHNQIRAFCFRDYQMPYVFGKSIISDKVTNIRSYEKPGTVIKESDSYLLISSVDYYIYLFKDRFVELLDACENGDLRMAQEICSVTSHISSQNNKGWSPLMVATYNNQKDVAYFLISMGADIKLTNYNGTNLLMYAKEAYKNYGDNELFKFYRNLGLRETTKDYYENDLLYYLENDGIELEELLK